MAMVDRNNRQRSAPLTDAASNGDAFQLTLAGLHYRVCGIPAEWRDRIPAKFDPYRFSGADRPARTIHVRITNSGRLRPARLTWDTLTEPVFTQRGDGLHYQADLFEAEFLSAALSDVRMDVHRASGPWFSGILETMLRLLVAHDILDADGLMLHSAAVVHRQQAAVLFGHSGVGKSTCSALAASAGYGVVSDDINVLRRGRRGWEVLAVPFTGTYPAAGHGPPVPLVALYALQQARRNETRPCSSGEAIALLTGSAPFVNREPSTLERVLDVVGRLASEVPVRQLSFDRSGEFLNRVFGPTAEESEH